MILLYEAEPLLLIGTPQAETHRTADGKATLCGQPIDLKTWRVAPLREGWSTIGCKQCAFHAAVFNYEEKPPRDGPRVRINEQGSVIVSDARGHLCNSGPRVAAFHVDLVTANAEIGGYSTGLDGAGGPEIYLFAGDDSRPLLAGALHDSPTTLSFPDYPWWTVHSVQLAQYTLSVALVDRREPDVAMTNSTRTAS